LGLYLTLVQRMSSPTSLPQPRKSQKTERRGPRGAQTTSPPLRCSSPTSCPKTRRARTLIPRGNATRSPRLTWYFTAPALHTQPAADPATGLYFDHLRLGQTIPRRSARLEVVAPLSARAPATAVQRRRVCRGSASRGVGMLTRATGTVLSSSPTRAA
jgi:hypothetical protein